MKHFIKQRHFFFFLLMAMCIYSLNVDAETQDKKKKKKNEVNQVNQMIQEDYGNTVTLVTSGSGASEDEATRNALRNAIEQAYGTFVSANTTVVNDELVSDAIATVSSGNVLGYEQISCLDTDEGCIVSVKAVVSIGGLVSFAQNKGMETELAGNTFLQNKRLAKLNKENEKKALSNLVDQLYVFLSTTYDYSVNVGQPSGDGVYSIWVTIKSTPNDNMKELWNMIDKTLTSLSMSPAESRNYQSLGLETYQYCYVPEGDRFKIFSKQNLYGIKSRYNLRTNIGRVSDGGSVITDDKTEYNLLQILKSIETIGKYSYEIYDNIGTVITPTIEEGANKVGRSIDGFRLGPGLDAKTFSIVLKSTGHGGARYNIPSNARDNSFQLIYQESQLSRLQKISVRPHSIKFE